jgi:hypothetical protein
LHDSKEYKRKKPCCYDKYPVYRVNIIATGLFILAKYLIMMAGKIKELVLE